VIREIPVRLGTGDLVHIAERCGDPAEVFKEGKRKEESGKGKDDAPGVNLEAIANKTTLEVRRGPGARWESKAAPVLVGVV
jgi:hypothetical protein